MSDQTLDAEDLARLRELGQRFMRAVPHNNALGLELRAVGDGRAEIFLPYDARLVGNPETGVLHGGAVTALVDQTSGFAVFMRLPVPTRIATLDLRIDYLGPSRPGRPLRARAECYRLAKHVAFTRAEAYQDHEDGRVLVAASMATFMVFSDGRSPMKEALEKASG